MGPDGWLGRVTKRVGVCIFKSNVRVMSMASLPVIGWRVMMEDANREPGPVLPQCYLFTLLVITFAIAMRY